MGGRVAGLILATLGCLAGCETPVRPGPAPASERDRAPSRLSAAQYQALITQPDPVPRLEPRSPRGNPPEYTVLGKTYQLLPTAAGYEAEGIASWYGEKFHGRLTSSGEPFDMLSLTAAHRELPIPTFLEVTNLENNRTIVVRVNDRGPFHAQRVVDVSYAAAVKLGFSESGTAPVRIRTLPAAGNVPRPGRPAQERPLQERPPLPPTAEPRDVYFVQVGAFSESTGARTLKDRLSTLLAADLPVAVAEAGGWYRVRVGPLATPEAAMIVKWDLAQQDIRDALVLAETWQACSSRC